jgi:hypothetical protein
MLTRDAPGTKASPERSLKISGVEQPDALQPAHPFFWMLFSGHPNKEHQDETHTLVRSERDSAARQPASVAGTVD